MESIFAYTDYREYLRDEFKRKQKRNSAFSLRAAASRIGIGSASLSRIISGTRNIGPALLPNIISLLGLRPREAEYLGCMIRFARATRPGDRRQEYERMRDLRSLRRHNLETDECRLFEEWHNLALHQLLRIVPRCADPQKLGSMLLPLVTESKVRGALDLLLQCGLITKNEKGGYSPQDISLTTGEVWMSAAIHGLQKITAGLAILAMDEIPKEERDVSTLTLCLSQKSLEAAREIMRTTRQELLALDENESTPERVYHFNFHLFPITRPLREKDIV